MKDPLNNNTRYFVQFIEAIRPARPSDIILVEKKLQEKIASLSADQHALMEFQANCRDLLLRSNIQTLFQDTTGVFSSDNLLQQLFKDIKHKILPPLEDKNSINYKMRIIFHDRNDHTWVMQIPNETWLELFALSGIDNSFIHEHFRNTLLNMFTMLSYKIAALGLDEELSSRFMESGEIISPFIEQNKEVSLFLETLEEETLGENTSKENFREYTLSHILVMLNQCLANIDNIRKNTLTYGTSLKQSYLLNRLENKINRLKILVDIVDEKEFDSDRFISFFKEIIYNENHRNNIGHLLSQNVGYLAYQIAEHKGNIGEHYITETRKEYALFFSSAFGGGAIIAFLVFIKMLASNLPFTDFWMAVCYSFIYGIGFVVIHLLGFTVATKQPAMTASALASSLDNRKNQGSDLYGVALMMAKVSRSQLIAVIGNLAAVFPVALGISYLYHAIYGEAITNKLHAIKYLYDIHPLHSLCWLYGGIAGMYLFLSGIVAGYFDNAVIYGKIPERIREHPGLQSVFSARRLKKIARYFEHNLGAIMGNIMIGIFLGTASFIGKTLGIPFDIRHVTFSMGSFAISLHSLSFQIDMKTIEWIIAGILSIGFFNIAISFGMAFYVALKSRNIKFREFLHLPKLILTYFVKFPLDFFYPPKQNRTEEEVFPEKSL